MTLKFWLTTFFLSTPFVHGNGEHLVKRDVESVAVVENRAFIEDWFRHDNYADPNQGPTNSIRGFFQSLSAPVVGAFYTLANRPRHYGDKYAAEFETESIPDYSIGEKNGNTEVSVEQVHRRRKRATFYYNAFSLFDGFYGPGTVSDSSIGMESIDRKDAIEHNATSEELAGHNRQKRTIFDFNPIRSFFDGLFGGTSTVSDPAIGLESVDRNDATLEELAGHNRQKRTIFDLNPILSFFDGLFGGTSTVSDSAIGLESVDRNDATLEELAGHNRQKRAIFDFNPIRSFFDGLFGGTSTVSDSAIGLESVDRNAVNSRQKRSLMALNPIRLFDGFFVPSTVADSTIDRNDDLEDVQKEAVTRSQRRKRFVNPLNFFTSLIEDASPPNIPYVVLPSIYQQRPLAFQNNGAIPSHSGPDPYAIPYNGRGLGRINEGRFSESSIGASGQFSEYNIGSSGHVSEADIGSGYRSQSLQF